jgi:hypothetical protein
MESQFDYRGKPSSDGVPFRSALLGRTPPMSESEVDLWMVRVTGRLCATDRELDLWMGRE